VADIGFIHWVTIRFTVKARNQFKSATRLVNIVRKHAGVVSREASKRYCVNRDNNTRFSKKNGLKTVVLIMR